MKMSKTFLFLFIAAAAAMTACGGAAAADRTWDGGGTTDNWTDAANWDAALNPPNDSLIFAGTVRLTPYNNYAAATAFTGITFNAGGFSVSGNALTLTGNVTNNAGSNTLSNDMAMAATRTFNVATSTSLTANGVLTGVGGLIKTGSGTLTLGDVNSYSGGTTISAGTVNAGNLGVAGGSSSLGKTNTPTVLGSASSKGTVNYTGGSTTYLRGFTIGGAGGGEILNNGAGLLTIRSDITGSGFTLSLGGSGDILFQKSIQTGTGALIKNDTGTVTLTVTSTRTGPTTINGGTLAYGTTNALSSGNVTVSGGVLNMAGYSGSVGAVTLSSGTITGAAGVLTGTSYTLHSGTVSAVIAGTGPMTKTSSGTATLTRANTRTGTTTISNGVLSVSDIGNGGVAGNLGAATNAAANLVFDGGTLRYTGANASTDRNFTINTGKTATIDVTSNTLTMSGVTPATTGGLTKSGAGGLTLTGAQVYTGATTVSGGVLTINGWGSIADTSALVLTGDGIFDISTISATGETVGSLQGESGTSVALGGKKLTAGGNNTSTTFAGILSGTGGSLTKTGTGKLTLTGVNAHTGGTTISAGTLSIPHSAALGLESNLLTIDAGAVLEATDSFTTSRMTTLGGAGSGVGGTFDVVSGKKLEYTSASVISGSGSLIKTGAGTLSLGGSNTYTGGTYIKAGTLVSNSGYAPGPQPPPGSNDYAHHIYDGAVLQIASGSWSTERQIELVGGTCTVDIISGVTQQRNGLIYGGGKLNLSGEGRMIVINANSYTGGTIIENGILQVNNASGSATGTGAVTVKSGGTLSGLPTAQGDYAGITGSISGTVEVQSGGELLAQSGGTLTLGGLTLKAGALSSFYIGALTTASLVNITGENLFTLPGASTVEIFNTGLMEVGTYRLFDYSGADPVFTNLSLAASHIGMFNLALEYNTTDKRIDLLVSAITNQWIKGGNTNWSNAANWSENNVPDSPGESALFMNNAGQPGFGSVETATVDTSKTVGAVTFDNTATAFTINASSGQTLTLDGAGAKAVIQSLRAPEPADHVISAPLILASDLTVNTAAGTHGIDISGAIAGEGKSLSKKGSGYLTLSGGSANTYSGLTRVESGTLYLNKTAGVDAVGAGGLDIETGVTAALMASNQIADTATVSVAGTFALGTYSETVAAVTGGGTVTTGAGSVLTIANNEYSEFLGTISGLGGIAKAGSGILRLAGSNSYSGGTAINAGTLRVGADNRMGDPSGVLTFDGGTILFAGGFTSGRNVGLNSGGGTLDTSGNEVTLTGVISGGGSLTKIGQGVLTLSHSNSYTGATNVNNGILRITNASALGSAAAGTTVNPDGELEIDGNGLTINEPLTLNGGVICNLAGTNTWGGAVTLTADSGIDADAGTLVITAAIGESGGAHGLTKEGPGTVELANANTYTGRTVVEQGTLKLTGGAAIADTGAVRMDNTAGATLLLNAHETIGSLEGGGSTGGNVELGAHTLTVGDDTSTVFAGVISGTGGALKKQGSGTMTLSGVNTYTGGTTISAGALSVANSSALGLESNTLTIGAGATLKTTGSFDTSRATALGGAGSGVGGTFETDSGTTLEYTSTSVISGSGSLIKTGAGTLLLDGLNTYTGGTYIKEGTLTLTNSQSAGPQPEPGLSDYALHIYDGATLRETGSSWTTERKVELVSGIATIGITPASTVTNKGEIYGSGALNLTGGGTIIVTGSNTYTGGTVVQEGILQVNNTSGSATGTGDVTVKMGGTLSGLTDTSATGSVSGKVTVESGGPHGGQRRDDDF